MDALLFTDQVIAARPASSLPIVETHLISATDLRGALNNFATYCYHRPLFESFSLPFIAPFLFFSSPLFPSAVGRYAYGSFRRRKTNFNKP